MQGQFDERGMSYRPRGRKMYHGANIQFILKDDEIDQVATAASGSIRFKPPYELLMVQFPGGDKTAVEVTDEHRREYREQYEAFRANLEQPVEGTPLSQWPILPRAVVAELNSIGVKTVEQLAEPTPETKKKLLSNQQYVKKAKLWLESANSTQAQVTALTEQNEALQARLKKTEEQLEVLIQRVEASEGTRIER